MTLEEITKQLTTYIHTYERIGYDSRPISFRPDGLIYVGAGGCERSWNIKEVNNNFILDIKNGSKTTCTLILKEDGWHGRWLIAEKMPVRIVPTTTIVPKFIEEPSLLDKFRKEDFSLVIQGPINPRSLNNIENYKKFVSKIIVSHWHNDDKTWFDQYDMTGIETIYSPFTGNREHRQFTTLRAGLGLVKTPYCIKARSDEYYSDLSALINKILLYPDKLVTNNILFLSNKRMHPSDHLFVARTGFMRDMSDNFLRSQFQKELPLEYCTEQRMALSFLAAKNVKVNMDNIIEITKENFDVVPCSRLGRFVWTTNQRGIHSNRDNPNELGTIGWGYSISDLSQL